MLYVQGGSKCDHSIELTSSRGVLSCGTFYKVVLTFKNVGEILTKSATIQMKATGQYFPGTIYCVVQGSSNFLSRWSKS